MKKVLFAMTILLSISMISCKNSGEKSENNSEVNGNSNSPKLMDSEFKSYSGEYYYSKDGAVLKGSSFIYAVTLDELAKELGERIKPIKKEDYDMVPVVVTGIVEKNPAFERGEKVWEEIITIKEIISVSETPAEIDIKLEEKKS